MFPGLTSLQILQKIHGDLQERNIEPEKFGDRIIFMSMFNDIDRVMEANEETCISNSEKVKTYAQRFLETKRSGMGTAITNPKENGIPLPHTWYNDSKIQVIQFSEMPVH